MFVVTFKNINYWISSLRFIFYFIFFIIFLINGSNYSSSFFKSFLQFLSLFTLSLMSFMDLCVSFLCTYIFNFKLSSYLNIQTVKIMKNFNCRLSVSSHQDVYLQIDLSKHSKISCFGRVKKQFLCCKRALQTSNFIISSTNCFQ